MTEPLQPPNPSRKRTRLFGHTLLWLGFIWLCVLSALLLGKVANIERQSLLTESLPHSEVIDALSKLTRGIFLVVTPGGILMLAGGLLLARTQASDE